MKICFLYISAIIVCLGFISCETGIDKTIPNSNKVLVVDCILTTDLKQQELRLTRSFSDQSQSIIGVSDASIFVLNQAGQSYKFSESLTEAGLYLSEEIFAVSTDEDYIMQLVVNDSLYTANSLVAEVIKDIPEPQYQEVDSITRRIADFIPYYDENEQAMYRLDIDWSHIMPDTTNTARVYFYTFSDIDIGSLLPGELELLDFPVGSILSITKYGLTEEFAEFLRAAVIESRWSGGVYFNASGTIPTNIQPDGLGFFTASTTFTQTFSVQ